jgi:UDP-N-acetylmuramoylalanine--D-glutamate ligase
MRRMNIKNKRVLLVGLGILGGGVSTAKWLCDNGAILTITDLKDEKYLKSSISKLQKSLLRQGYEGQANPSSTKLGTSKPQIKYVLGKHNEEDFKSADLIVLNPDVPIDSPFVKIAKKHKIPITNELNLFCENVKSKNIVAVTGTRGKTTTTQWTAYLMNKILGSTHLVGNSPRTPFLGMINKIKENDFVVLEVPSYHLEIVNKSFRPKVSVITNIFIDHINRHKTEENYAKIKFNICKNQTKDDYLILNKNNKWIKEFIKKKLKPNLIFLPNNKVLPSLPNDFGEHNKQNLAVAIMCIKIFGGNIKEVAKYIKDLPQPLFRQEKIFENKNLKVINDSTATSPEATIAAVKRFSGTVILLKKGIHASSNKLILITGGTDKGLEYRELGKFLSKNIKSENLILLGGSATEKLKKYLKFPASAKGYSVAKEFDTLEECLVYAKLQISKNKSPHYAKATRGTQKTTIVFSPGAKSFEKFKNEFDRGEKFNKLVKDILLK